MNIPPITSISPTVPSQPGPSSPSGDFASVISVAINQVEGAGAAARTAASDLLAGKGGDIHTVAIASQRAELSMELFQQVRNKFVQAYQEIMRMPM